MAFDREAAKADGWTDEDIDSYLATKNQPLPTEKPIERGEEMWGTAAATVPTAVELGALGYGVKKIAESWRGGPSISPEVNAGSPADIAKKFVTPTNATPITPTPAANPTMSAPSAVPQAAAAQQSAISKAMETASKMRQLAAEFATQNASKMLKGGVGLSAALYSPNLGPAVPSSGPARGSEFNPATGRPWTQQELDAYNRRGY